MVLASEKHPLLEEISSDRDSNPQKSSFTKFEKTKLSNDNLSASSVHRMSISWRNIYVHAKPKMEFISFQKYSSKKLRCILRNVNGKVEPGQILAIMGASGAGKTTLLNVLTNRNLHNFDVTGKVKINGWEAGPATVRFSAYVQQQDMFYASLTVREHLTFQAMLRMDKHFSSKERMMQIENVISELSLTKCANTRIGNPGSKEGISGGERKRLAFASEVLTNPTIMFCDEPTSGLDSFMSASIVAVLKKLAEGGRTIIFTIHQPSSEVYDLFDNILLMVEGSVAYMGDKSGAISHFQAMKLHVPINYNPADFFISKLAIIPGQEEECRNLINGICDLFDKSKSATENTEEKNEDKSSKDLSLPQISRYKASWLTQMRMLLWRFYLKYKRDTAFFVSRLGVSLAVSLILGCFFFNQQLDQRGIMNINGALFLLLMQMCFRAFFSSVYIFCEDVDIFLREHGNGVYRIDTYFLSRSMVELPPMLVTPMICTAIFYWMIGLKPEINAFLICTFTVALAANVASSFGYMVSCASRSTIMALNTGPGLLLPLIIFGGFFLNNASIPPYFLWIRNLSWFFYANEVVVINQWSNIRNISCAIELGKEGCIHDGKGVIESLNFDETALIGDVYRLLALFLFYRIMALLFLYLKPRLKT